MKPKHIALLLTLIAFALRIHGLSFQPLWGDEGWSIYFAVMPLREMAALTALDIHPPLYYALLHGWFALTGPGAELARFLSVTIGALMVPAMYALGRTIFAPSGSVTRRLCCTQVAGHGPGLSKTAEKIAGWGGVAAAAVVAVAPMALYYSQEVRIYGLVTLLGMLSTLFFARAFFAVTASGTKQSPRPNGGDSFAALRMTFSPSIWAYIIVTTLALYTMYYAAFIVAFQAVYLLIVSGRSALRHLRQDKQVGGRQSAVSGQRYPKKRGRPSAVGKTPLFKAFLAIAILYLPWIIYAGTKLINYVQNKADVEGYISLSLPKFFASYLLAFSLGHPSEKLHPYTIAAGLVFALIALAGVWYLWRQSERCAEMQEIASGYALAMTDARSPAPPLPCSPAPLLLIALYLLVPLTLGWLVNLINPFTPPYFQRTLLIAAPAWWLLLSAGLMWLWAKQRALMVAAASLLLTISLIGLADFYTFPRYQDEDYRPLLSEIAARATPSDALLASYQWQLGYYHAYLPSSGPRFYPAPEWGVVWGTDSAAMQRDLSNLLEDSVVWFPAHQAAGHIWEDQAEAMMAEIGYPTLLRWYNPNTKLSLVAPNTPTEAGPNVNFAQQLQAQVSLPPAVEFESGRGVIPVEIVWTALSDPPENYLITLKLIDAEGETWAKRDAHPRAGQLRFTDLVAGETLIDRHGLLIAAGTPPGEYSLRLALTDPTTERPLDIPDESGQAQGAEAILMSVDVKAPRLPVGVEALALQSPLDVNFDDQLKLVGYSVGATSVKTGETLPVNLFWQSLSDDLPELTIFVQLQDEGGKAVALTERSPVYPSTDWQTGTLLRDLHQVKIPASLPAGSYKLAAGVLQANKSRLASPSGDQAALGLVAVQERPHTFAPPSPEYPLEASFSGGATLVGYDLAPQTLKPGQSLTLTLYWRGEAGFDRNWAVFAHLIDADGRVWAQRDQLPGDGAFPTAGWISGEYISDTRQISIAASTPSGAYQLEVGLYDPNTFERVPIEGGGDAVALDTPVSVIGD